MAEVDRSSARPLRATRIMAWCSAVVVGTSVTVLAGVGLAALLGRQGDATFWNNLSNVGQAFGVLSSIISGLALAYLVVTSRVQFRELRASRDDLERQHQLLLRSNAELQRTAEAGRGQLHLDILKLAIDDPQLAEVWPPFQPGLTTKQNRQYLYANIIYQFQQTWMRVGGHSDEEVLDTMRYLFTSPIIRDYWRASARARMSLTPGSDEHRLAQKVDELWHEYEAVIAARRESNHGSVKDLRTTGDARDRSDSDSPATEAA
ncbi:DUF6082 family protein [Actinoplanes sp. CA-051413]|uniref:DUF6082 family protein n=1 Tax=Actinoplanes sp. CA-051413 TaxID=3239899 RepID=UPI003D95A5A0